MQEAWIQLRCPDCEDQWEANPSNLPAPQERMACESCGETRHVSELTKTARDLEVLEEFHGE